MKCLISHLLPSRVGARRQLERLQEEHTGAAVAVDGADQVLHHRIATGRRQHDVVDVAHDQPRQLLPVSTAVRDLQVKAQVFQRALVGKEFQIQITILFPILNFGKKFPDWHTEKMEIISELELNQIEFNH